MLTPVNEDAVDNLNISNSDILVNEITKVTTPNNKNDSVKKQITSTPDDKILQFEIPKTPSATDSYSIMNQQPHQLNYNYVDGKYKGEAIHADGNILDIIYTIFKHKLSSSNSTIYLVWISRDPNNVDVDEDCDDEKQFNLTLTINSLTSTIETSCGNGVGGATTIKNTAISSCLSNSISMMSSAATIGTNTLANITSQVSRPNSSIISQEEEQISGEYSKNYTTLKQIGKGAYGYVKMAYRNSDRLLVISKCILKEKLCSNFMVTTEDDKEIPMEIYLLMSLNHPNVVKALDIHENEKFFQLIMEKHGSGMDLFEFIDRRPLIDEKLGCFIFRQIANAVNYLHNLNVS